MDMPQEATEIWFRIEKDAEGYPKSQDWEQLYSWRTDDGFRIDNVPFFAKNIAVGDVVFATKTEEGWHRFDRVLSRGGHSAFRVWLSQKLEPNREHVLQEIRRLGGRAELTLERLIAIDVPPECEPQIWNYLDAGRAKGEWDLQVGYSPE
jgi:hypothetical protein